MHVDHASKIVGHISSPARIELRDTYVENLHFYEENSYDYIPMPFDGLFFDRKNNEMRELEEGQYIMIDSTIRNAIGYLSEYPFLLSKNESILAETSDGELVVEGYNTPNEWDRLGYPEEVLEEMPGRRNEVIELCESESIYEIITLADVNRRHVRDTIYPVLAELESRFASEIKSNGDKSEELFPELSPETIGRWEKAKLGGVEMHIAEYMTLAELMKVVGKNEHLRQKFGYSSRNQFANELGGLVDLRNKVMHASRTMVTDRSDLEQLIKRISRAESTIESHGGSVNRRNYKEPNLT